MHEQANWRKSRNISCNCFFSQWLAFLGIMGTYLRLPLKPPNTICAMMHGGFWRTLNCAPWYRKVSRTVPDVSRTAIRLIAVVFPNPNLWFLMIAVPMIPVDSLAMNQHRLFLSMRTRGTYVHEWVKWTKSLLAVIYGSPRRHSNSFKNLQEKFEKIEINLYDHFRWNFDLKTNYIGFNFICSSRSCLLNHNFIMHHPPLSLPPNPPLLPLSLKIWRRQLFFCFKLIFFHNKVSLLVPMQTKFHLQNLGHFIMFQKCYHFLWPKFMVTNKISEQITSNN